MALQLRTTAMHGVLCAMIIPLPFAPFREQYRYKALLSLGKQNVNFLQAIKQTSTL